MALLCTQDASYTAWHRRCFQWQLLLTFPPFFQCYHQTQLQSLVWGIVLFHTSPPLPLPGKPSPSWEVPLESSRANLNVPSWVKSSQIPSAVVLKLLRAPECPIKYRLPPPPAESLFQVWWNQESAFPTSSQGILTSHWEHGCPKGYKVYHALEPLALHYSRHTPLHTPSQDRD